MRISLSAAVPLFFAWKSLRTRRLQTFLILIALTISYGAALVIFAVLTSFRERVATDLSRIGWNVINVHPAPDLKSLLQSLLTPELVSDLASVVQGEGVGAALETVLVSAGGAANSPGGERARHAALAIGTSSRWAAVAGQKLLEGRFFEEGEADACVLDAWLSRQLLGEGSVIGKKIEAAVDGKPLTLRVVGVAEDPFKIRERFSSLEGPGASRSFVVRMMEYKNVYLPMEILGKKKPMLLAVIGVPPDHNPAEDVLKIRKRLKERGCAAMAWDRRSWAERLIGATGQITGVASFLWVTILAITALMSAVVLAVAVRGRYGEIAIRRVEGAGRAHILCQLLWESALISISAGVGGFLLARTGGFFLEEKVLGWPVWFHLRDVTLVLAAGVGLALLTTSLPAWRAATLLPVEVLSRRLHKFK